MADSILEKIALAIKARLEAITVTPGSCAITVSAVYRPTRAGVPAAPADWSITLEQGSAAPLDVRSNTHLFWEQGFTLGLNLRPANDSADPVDTLVNKFRAEVEKAVMSDPQWTVLGDELALNTFLGGCDRFGGQGIHSPPGYDGIELKIAVQYKTLERDPYSK